MFDRAVSDALARQMDKAKPLFLTPEDVRTIAEQVTRNLLGAISLDVSDFKAQAATAAEITQWRSVNQTFGSVVKKVFLSVATVIGAGIGSAVLYYLGRSK